MGAVLDLGLGICQLPDADYVAAAAASARLPGTPTTCNSTAVQTLDMARMGGNNLARTPLGREQVREAEQVWLPGTNNTLQPGLPYN